MSDLDSIHDQPLEQLVDWMYSEAQLNAGGLDGAAMAMLARRLIAAEQAPGGPYRNEKGHIDEGLNRRIAELFRRLGVYLPGLETYVASLPLSESYSTLQPIDWDRARRHNRAQQRVQKMISKLANPLRIQSMHLYRQILHVDSDGEISRLAELFAESLPQKPTSDYGGLGAANLLAWIAYSVYDDFADEEGNPEALPAANQAHRDALLLFTRYMPDEYRPLAIETFTKMDEANAWELTYCRYPVKDNIISIGPLPRYGYNSVLARRAAAHILGPLIIMRVAGYDDEVIEVVRSALYDYLIARQFNDDLHDWVEDVCQGHISPVVAGLIRQLEYTPGDYALDETIKSMRDVFWRTGLTEHSMIALKSIKQAESKLVATGLFEPNAPFVREVLRPIRDSLERGMERHRRDKAFYEAYRSSTV